MFARDQGEFITILSLRGPARRDEAAGQNLEPKLSLDFPACRYGGSGGWGVCCLWDEKGKIGIVDHGSGSCVVLTRAGDLAASRGCYSPLF